jgi:hypothetical protein
MSGPINVGLISSGLIMNFVNRSVGHIYEIVEVNVGLPKR